ncbi:MAG: hypothetical protein JRJ84_18920 [Deltaproteobacteria bacterium]|nr:hypothetical protein [Deltaproteobacteria bacterium]
MLTDRGRVIEVTADKVRVCLGAACSQIDTGDLVLDLEDRATFLLCLDALAVRTGLDPSTGFLFYLSEAGAFGSEPAWVLEGNDEVRTRDADTRDPKEALARALVETAPE